MLVPRRPYFPHPLALCCHYPVSKCHSASTTVTGTVRVKTKQKRKVFATTCTTGRVLSLLTLTVPVMTIDALQYFETG